MLNQLNEKIIMCVDMDAFFASVEAEVNPSLKGKPLAVTGRGVRRVITTSSYEARRFGVKTGMNIYEAKRLCPDLILITGDTDKYIHTAEGLKEIYLNFTPIVEIYSIDEAFLDITGSIHLFGSPLEIGGMIKSEIKKRFNINATVGIGPDKIIAKFASDISKPDGLCELSREDFLMITEETPCDELWGIGRKIAERLRLLNINTCGELRRAPQSLLRNHFGIYGERLKLMAMGFSSSDVTTEEKNVRSIGHSTTLPVDIWRRDDISRWILRLSEMVSIRARRHGLQGRTIGVTLRYKSFETFTRQKRLKISTNDTHIIYNKSMEIIDSLRLREPVRLLGVTLLDLEEVSPQVEIFFNKRKALFDAMDRINRRFGEFTITWAPCKIVNPNKVISPMWRPHGVRKSL